MVETQVGGAGDFNSSSSSYRFQPGIGDGGSTLGEITVGDSASANYQSRAGFNTTGQPALTVVVNTGSVNLGTLTSGTSNTATATFSVINYTSYGYVVTMAGTAPANSGTPLTSLSTDTAPNSSVEQFGINLRANTSPATVGADPVQTPTGPPTFGYGEAGDTNSGGTTYGVNRPYTVANSYRYAPGEVIASAPKSSGQTDYTVSFMASISPTTRGGHYSSNMEIIVTGTY